MSAEDEEDNGRGLSASEIRDNVRILLFAGSETTATSMTWTVALLGHFPEFQEKVYDDVDRAFEQSSDPEFIIQNTPFLRQVIQEVALMI